ncbi:hypothetical protein DAEQUDRAFT_758130 [Daedalea quercina L-15889]|uniref:Uncharacterized protein n=1 Tax=Daedalea quercina L-15889 TaxID=1314783 RepID=A0A165NUT4_9APHY|nr:hypothetical protein DAEQUDRAFT_758130 [Daedalea quercina L-15889]
MVKERTEAQKARATNARIPQTVDIAPRSSHIPSYETETANSDGSAVDKSEHVHQALLALGAPLISSDDMRRLCKGPLGDALFFMAEHMKGRAEVNRARQTIQQMREAGPSSRVTGDGQETEYMKAKHAMARLNGAKNDFNGAETQLNAVLQTIDNSQREADRLQAVLDNKRKALFLLQILEKKETVRISRIKEVERLMSQLQADSARLTDDPVVPVPKALDSKPKQPMKRIQADHTQDVLAALRSYHVRLSRKTSASSDDPQSAETRRRASEARLRAALGEDAGELIQKCERIARIRTERNIRYESPLPSGFLDELGSAHLDEMHARVSEKERKLQRLLDEIAGLEKACTQSIQSLSAFDEFTRPALRQSLQEEVRNIEGYIDVLRAAIMQVADEPGPQDESIAGGKSWRQALSKVQTDIEQAHAKDAFLQSTTLLEPSSIRDCSRRANVGELIASHRARQAHINERNTSLLARKLEKARFGDALGKQVEKLLAEKDIIAAMSGTSK